MYSLEAAIVHCWQRKTLSEEELLDAADVGRVVYRIWIGFAGFAFLILCLSLGAQPNGERPQVAAVANIHSAPAEGR
ncbi:hypothetical protein RHSP_34561 [Rhizobium freirei PRF 81]|uniref:Transmembrane protein n=1 Tax=Rhizobium freirei PRF 81 TaxID=363754 RepID=N6U7I7_9HYPH|nr:hypothetical protein [Rhizobium freirei]ENN86243.1 hypothetical protein RHSP_34561 [Rhizobium freirei PRF 81]